VRERNIIIIIIIRLRIQKLPYATNEKCYLQPCIRILLVYSYVNGGCVCPYFVMLKLKQPVLVCEIYYVC